MISADYLSDFIDDLADRRRRDRGQPVGFRDERAVYVENMLWRAARLEDFARRTRLTMEELTERDALLEQIDERVMDAASIARGRHRADHPPTIARATRGPSATTLYLESRPKPIDPFAA